MHAYNMAMLMLGKDKNTQLHKAFYPYESSGGNRHELYGNQYANEVIGTNFGYQAKQIGD